MIGSVQGLQGEFRRAALDEPISVQVGDLATVIGDQIVITRGGAVIATRSIVGPHEAVPLEAVNSEIVNHVLYFWRKPVAGVVATLTDVTKDTSSGAITFWFSDGTSTEYANGTQAMNSVAHLHTDNGTAKLFLVLKTMINSPDETNLTTMFGATCTIDGNANQPVNVRRD